MLTSVDSLEKEIIWGYSWKQISLNPPPPFTYCIILGSFRAEDRVAKAPVGCMGHASWQPIKETVMVENRDLLNMLEEKTDAGVL